MNKNTPQPLFNKDQLRENHRGVEDLIPSTINEFLTYIDEMQAQLENAYDNQSEEETTLAAHSLKGAVASVCSTPLKELAYEIENLSREKTGQNLKPLIVKLHDGIKRLSADLEEYKKELSENAESS